MTVRVPFNRPFATGKELTYIQEAIGRSHLSGDGEFTRRCNAWLEKGVGCKKALLTHSCTGALEMAAILAGVGPGDEVIMPSYSFVSTANAFVLRGAVPVFVDVDESLNLDVGQLPSALTVRTRAIVPVHYAGMACDMDEVVRFAGEHNLLVVEDAAQALSSRYKGRPLGSIGQLATVSFHETKNVICGEGGALLINDERFLERAEIIREKGTNRSKFFRGQVDKYSWVDIGSSYLPSEIIAAFLWAQMESADSIRDSRLHAWWAYHHAFEEDERAGTLRRPVIPPDVEQNGHLYYLLLRDLSQRKEVLSRLNAQGINAVFHYVPLHSSAAGRRYGKTVGELPRTTSLADRLLRLPLWVGMSEEQIEFVIRGVREAIGRS
jgi:dTDP-4-amino-4,6-dideoxygalactose transaminase